MRMFKKQMDKEKDKADKIVMLPDENSYSDPCKPGMDWNKNLVELVFVNDENKETILKKVSINRTVYHECIFSIFLSKSQYENYKDKLDHYAKPSMAFNEWRTPQKDILEYSILIPNLAFLQKLLKTLVNIDPSFKRTEDTLSNVKQFIREIPSAYGWSRAGFPKDKIVEYRSGNVESLVQSVLCCKRDFIFKIDPTQYLSFVKNMKENGYQDNEMRYGYRWNPACFAVSFRDDISALKKFFETAIKIDPRLKSLAQDLFKLHGIDYVLENVADAKLSFGF